MFPDKKKKKKKSIPIDPTWRIIIESCQIKRTVGKRFCVSFMPVARDRGRRKRGEAKVGETSQESRHRDWGRFPLILNKEHKVVLFPPGFQTVRNPPGVKHDPLSLSITRPLRFAVLCLVLGTPFSPFSIPLLTPSFFSLSLFFIPFRLRCGSGDIPHSLLMLQIQFLSLFFFLPSPPSPRIGPLSRGKGEKPQKGLRPGERIVSLSFAIVRVTARESRNLSCFFSPSLSLLLSLSFSLSFFEERSS